MAVLAAGLATPVGHPAAQEMLFDGSQYGRITLTLPQSTAHLESVLGESANFEPIAAYSVNSRLRLLGSAVGRLDIRFGESAWMDACTAFLISETYLLTNHHCVPGNGRYGPATGASILFGYVDVEDPVLPERFVVDPVPVEADSALDYAILRVEGEPAARWGVSRLAALDPGPGEPLQLIQHPAGFPMYVTRRACRAALRAPIHDVQILHSCDTMPGSSGSPVFNEDGVVVGLHHGSLGESNVAIRMKLLAEASPIIAAIIGAAATSPVTGPVPVPDTGSDTTPGAGPFRDPRADGGVCAYCPEMMEVPAGGFAMGSPPGEPDRAQDEGPQREVAVGRFALGRHPVTRGEFAAFVAATGYDASGGCAYWDNEWLLEPARDWRNPGFTQADDHPVTCVSWGDARAYAAWLSEETGQPYRQPSEAEWEYAARAGTAGARYWGTASACVHANVGDQSTAEAYPGFVVAPCRDGFAHTAPVGSFAANGFGLHDMLGNVWSWTQDCANWSYAGAPVDGSAWESGNCDRRVLRGGSWMDRPDVIRAAFRSWFTPESRVYTFGFRVARDL